MMQYLFVFAVKFILVIAQLRGKALAHIGLYPFFLFVVKFFLVIAQLRGKALAHIGLYPFLAKLLEICVF